MTNKEAINILSSLPLQAPSDSELVDIQTAVRMAIEALEIADEVNPCSNCHEWDCYGCKVKETEE